MTGKLSYEELEQKIKLLEKQIKDLKQVEGRLRLLNTAVEQSKDGFIVADLEGNIIELNETFARMHGYSADELEGKNLSICHNREQIKAFEKVLETTRERGSFRGEVWHAGQDGSVFPSLVSYTLLYDEDGNPNGMAGTCRDITDIKTREEKLRESEVLYRSLVDDTPKLIARFLPNFEITYVNQALCDFVGMRPEEIIGNSLMILLSEGNQQRSKSLISRLSPDHPVASNDFKVMSEKGEIRWQRWTNRAVYNSKGEAVSYLCIGEDVTERKQFEDALEQSERRYRELFDNMNSGVAVYDASENGESFVVKDFNRAAERFEGVTRERILGKSVEDVFPGIREFGLFDVFRRVWKTGIAEHHPIAQYKDDRIQGWRENFVYKLPSGEVVAAYTDETSRMQAEARRKESEVKYRTMMDAMKDMAYICSSDYRITYMNPAMISKVGYDATGEACYKALFHNDQACSFCRMDELGPGKHVTYEVFVPERKEHLSISVSPLQYPEGAMSRLIIIRDVTEMKLLEEQLLRSQKMQAVGNLAGGIAHEFNNMLGIIIGNAELSLDMAPEGTVLENNLKQICTTGFRARDIVKQILAFSRLTRSDVKPVSLISIVNDTFRFVRSFMPSTIEIRKSITAGSDTIAADGPQIKQIILNLCNNAAYAMRDEGGVLEIALQNVELDDDSIKNYSGLASGRYIRLTIEDSGCGIKKGDLEQIFDPFFTTKEVGKGTGMGLAVVHGIVKAHHGDIKVTSEAGRGTSFHVLFPVVGDKAVPDAEVVEKAPQGKERLLFVDDEESLINVAKTKLEKMGYHVIAETNPVLALDVIRQKGGGFDLVITDMTMPEMTGDRFAKEIMKIYPDLPVILCTGYTDRISEAEAKEMGIKAFLMKPFLPSELARTVRGVLDKGRTG